MKASMQMHQTSCVGLLLVSLATLCTAKVWEIPLPQSLQDCYNQVAHADIETYVGSTYSWFCETAIKKSQMNGPATFDSGKMGYYKQLYDRTIEYAPEMRSFSHTNSGSRFPARRNFRIRRQAGQQRCLRREYRMLTDQERTSYHNALNTLKQDTTVEPNKYDAIALLHTGMAAFTAHGGAGFPGWHRIYILMFETALREVDPAVCLPYWDSSLDAELEDPTLSPVWSADFFGTSNGPVTDGPMSGWETPEGVQLIRNVGSDGDPFTSAAIEDILSQNRHIDILTSAETEPRFDLEFHHAAVHVYVGGTMGQLDTAAFDPIFFMHHAFVDYVWELFRTNLRSLGVNPEVYPVVEDIESRHHATGQTGFGNMTQEDGYSDFLTESYEYEAAPICSQQFPQCGSRYLTCFTAIGRCVPVDPEQVVISPNPTSPITPGNPSRPVEPRRPRPDNRPVPITNPARPGRTIEPNPTIPQPQGPRPVVPNTQPNHVSPNQRPINPTNPARPNPILITPGFSPINPNIKPVEPTFPNAGTCTKVKTTKNYGNAVQNDYCCDKSCDSNEWATIPVKVVSVRPPQYNSYQSYPVKNGKVSRSSDIYAPSAYDYTKRWISNKQANPKTYKRCSGDNNIGQVFISSKGINYDGYYKEAAIVDNRLPVSISMGFINIKKPSRFRNTKVLLRAHDSCGRVCHTACKDKVTGEFKACSGAVELNSLGPNKMYGDTFDQAVESVFHYNANNDCPSFKAENFFITFYCDYHIGFPYTQHSHGVPKPEPKSVKPQPLPVLIPRSKTGCAVTNQCTLDTSCTSSTRQCSIFDEKHQCMGSCRAYAVCTYGRYFLRLCPDGQYFDDHSKKCVTGFCQKVAGKPRLLDDHHSHGSHGSANTFASSRGNLRNRGNNNSNRGGNVAGVPTTFDRQRITGSYNSPGRAASSRSYKPVTQKPYNRGLMSGFLNRFGSYRG